MVVRVREHSVRQVNAVFIEQMQHAYIERTQRLTSERSVCSANMVRVERCIRRANVARSVREKSLQGLIHEVHNTTIGA